ncbi:hypothetical protein HDU97_003608 [Phlyctochytrium planicorne]|nr:hypothetical protein HDU97_003608 [Phlyctochytrium planicorne]
MIATVDKKDREELLKMNAEPEKTALETGVQLTDSLKQAIQMMSVELEKSVAASQVLDDSTRTLKQTYTQYNAISSVSEISKKILTNLQIQSMMDRLIILGGLSTFLLAAGKGNNATSSPAFIFNLQPSRAIYFTIYVNNSSPP